MFDAGAGQIPLKELAPGGAQLVDLATSGF